jgi:hypothetical protein
MKETAILAWTSLYLAVGIMGLMCAVFAVIQTGYEIKSGAWRPALDTKVQKALILPKVWLRWQVNYLRGAPVILAVAIYFAWYVGFNDFWDV